MMINKTRILNEFIELVSVPCPSKDEKAEADLLVQKLQAMGLEVKVDDAGRKIGGTTGNVWAFLPGNVEGAAGLFFEAHMDSVPPTTGTKVVRRDGVLYSDGTTTLGGDDKVGIAAGLGAGGGGGRSSPGACLFISALTVSCRPATFPGVWPHIWSRCPELWDFLSHRPGAEDEGRGLS